MMNRKLVLIISDGGGNAPLRGVHIDKNNYLNFFKAPEGGAWKDEEIKVFDNNDFDKEWIHSISLLGRLEHHPIDYFLIVYCGHGFTDQYGNIRLQVRTDCDLKLYDLLAAVGPTRCLVIADSCRAVYRLDEGGRIGDMRLFSTSDEARRSAYTNMCRTAYNECLAATPATMQMVLFSNSFGETADENKNGGLYSFAMLKAAKAEISRIHTLQEHDANSYMVDVDTIHEAAKQEVEQQTHQRQHPDKVLGSRSCARFPFVVVPHLQLQIPDED